MTTDGTLTPKNMTIESTIKFVWDKAYIEFITGKKFTTQLEFTNYITDTSVDLIKKSIEDKSIYWLFNLKLLDE
jgi:hypothetical protein